LTVASVALPEDPWTDLRADLIRCARHYVRDEDDAEEIAHVAILRLLKRRRGSAVLASPRSYLERCVLNALCDDARRRAVRVRSLGIVAALPARVPTPADLLDAAETERALVAAIARLPSRARTCFVQIELLGMSIDEVAAGSAVSAKAVELRLSSARKQLRSAIPA
jgi:RNA polymerase sigma factor (sigma-70 family)